MKLSNKAEHNEDVVRNFIAAWSRLDAEELANYFTDNGVYHNIPLAPARGRDNVEKLISSFVSTWTGTTWEIVNLVASDNVVIVERIDHTRGVGKSVDLPIVGVFELEDGKIKHWREYFDLAAYEHGMGKD